MLNTYTFYTYCNIIIIVAGVDREQILYGPSSILQQFIFLKIYVSWFLYEWSVMV